MTVGPNIASGLADQTVFSQFYLFGLYAPQPAVIKMGERVYVTILLGLARRCDTGLKAILLNNRCQDKINQ